MQSVVRWPGDRHVRMCTYMCMCTSGCPVAQWQSGRVAKSAHGVSKTPLQVSGHGSSFSSWRSTVMLSTSDVKASVSSSEETRITQCRSRPPALAFAASVLRSATSSQTACQRPRRACEPAM